MKMPRLTISTKCTYKFIAYICYQNKPAFLPPSPPPPPTPVTKCVYIFQSRLYAILGCDPFCDNEDSVFLDEDTAEWPGNNPASVKLGQVTAVDTDAGGNVVIFHRGSRRWQAE